ncbi:MEDS domain-containing protein [Asanoa sp. NPDC050611]|uniref:MEDS domain-containing protein n=1 Tax=Asanoa sp. NPDC050611 TaxID=3157098 RepID=UPI00340EF2D5
MRAFWISDEDFTMAVRPGDHLGAAFDTQEAFVVDAVAFAEQGVAAGGQVMVFPGDPYRDDLSGFLEHLRERSPSLAAADRSGQFRVADSRQVQLAPGRFDPGYLRRLYTAAAGDAVEAGYQGLWVSIDMIWARDADPAALTAFEAAAFPLFVGGRLTAVCHYDRRVFAPAVVAATRSAHPAAPDSREPLRHQRLDDGRTLRVWGDSDMDNELAFDALLGSLRPGDTLDISRMSFIDARGAAAIARVPGLAVEANQRQARLLGMVRAR